MAAGPFEKWVKGLRISWLKGAKAQAIMGGFVRVMGDLSAAYAERAQEQHFPLLCEDEALPLIGSERTIPQGQSETNANFKQRVMNAIPQRQRTETPLGLLTALHYGGFPGAVLVQQNGRAYQLDDPDEPYAINPTQTIAALGGNPNLSGAAAGHAWWTFDDDVDWCSRFAVLFDGVNDRAFRELALVTFDGTEDGSVAHPWPRAEWSEPFIDTTYITVPGPPVTSSGPVSVWCVSDATKTVTSITVEASGPFVGTVPVLAWPVGANPFAWLSAAKLARLRNIILDWKPARTKCMGIYALISGELWDWPVGTWDEAGGVWGPPSEVVVFASEGF